MSAAMTPALVQRVRDLVRLAIDGGAVEAEARTAALIACKLITKHSLVIAVPGEYRSPRYSPREREYNDRPMNRDRVITNRFATTCRRCREPIEIGDRCYWRKGCGCTCWECGS